LSGHDRPIAPTSLPPCLACGAPLRRWFRKAGRQLARCTDCGLVVVPAGLVRDGRGVSVYESETPVFLADGNESYYLDVEGNLDAARTRLAWIRRYLAEGSRVLDVGAGFGHFLSVARGVFDVAGLELSPAAVAFASDRLGVSCVLGSVYRMPASLRPPFDAVTAWDLIEHLHDPLSALRTLREAILPGGHLFLSTPDAGSFAARLLGRRWHYIDPVQHLTLFNRSNLARVLEQSGFETLGWRSFGRRYRLRYLVDRLSYLYGGPFRPVASAANRLLAPILTRSVPIRLGDVLGVAARRH
jgi:SAM-dependent methyltransferase